VLYDNGQYVMVCTGYLFPMRVSSNLVDWTPKGTIFTASTKPTWAQGNFWAPEIHKVGSHYVAYFTATFTDGKLSIGAASADSPTGPFNDIGKPLLHDSNMGLIDPSFIETNGKRYVIWKEDGNAVGKKTPIHSQELAADGLSVIGTASTLITNDQTWEGALVEGPWMIEHGGMYYLFYSANGYTSPQYAIGVARSSSPTSGFAKHPGPIVSTTNPWVGPGHNSVVHTPAGADYIVYHSWKQGQVGGGVGRVVLVDRIEWSNGWPSILSAPSHVSLPLPQ
jgi:beta-xylosidase